jgi:hypothetical protein
MVERAILEFAGEGLPGCRAESLLIASQGTLPPIRGLVDSKTARIYWNELIRLGIEAATLHLGSERIEERILDQFRDHVRVAR